MITRRNFVSASALILTSGALAACGGSGTQTTGGSSSAADTQTLTVAASPAPHAEILDDFAAPKLKEQGISLVVK